MTALPRLRAVAVAATYAAIDATGAAMAWAYRRGLPRAEAAARAGWLRLLMLAGDIDPTASAPGAGGEPWGDPWPDDDALADITRELLAATIARDEADAAHTNAGGTAARQRTMAAALLARGRYTDAVAAARAWGGGPRRAACGGDGVRARVLRAVQRATGSGIAGLRGRQHAPKHH